MVLNKLASWRYAVLGFPASTKNTNGALRSGTGERAPSRPLPPQTGQNSDSSIPIPVPLQKTQTRVRDGSLGSTPCPPHNPQVPRGPLPLPVPLQGGHSIMGSFFMLLRKPIILLRATFAIIETWTLSPPKNWQLQAPQEGNHVLLLLRSQVKLKNKIEEFNRIFKSKTAAVMQIRRRIFDAS